VNRSQNFPEGKSRSNSRRHKEQIRIEIPCSLSLSLLLAEIEQFIWNARAAVQPGGKAGICLSVHSPSSLFLHSLLIVL
jgi:hypothetical protein